MMKLIPIAVTAEETAVLVKAEAVAKAIWQRYATANPEYNKQLDLKLEFKPDCRGELNAWWHVRPGSEYGQSGMALTLAESFKEMFNHTEPEMKRKSAQRYRENAERLEKEAQALEAQKVQS